MGNLVPIKSKTQARKVLKDHSDIVEQSNVRKTVQNALEKLNDVDERIDSIENKGFFKRTIGSVTGSNQREVVSAMRDLSEAQNMTIQLVLSLAIMHSKNQQSLEDILDELDQSKGTYGRITDHIEFLYSQVESVKLSHKKKLTSLLTTQNIIKYGSIIIGIAIIVYIFIKYFSS